MDIHSASDQDKGRLPVISSAASKTKAIQDDFSRLEAECKVKIQALTELLSSYKDLDPKDVSGDQKEREISDLLKQARENVDSLKAISEDMNTIYQYKSLSPRVVDQAKTYALSVESVHATLRKLLMEFQQTSNRKHRQDLLNLTRSPFEEPRRRKFGNNAAETSQGITNSLLVSQQILTETLQRSQGTIDQLALTTKTIQDNQAELHTQGSVVNTAKNLLAKYGRREWTDKVLISIALCFFFACVLYVVQRRIL